MPISLFHSSIHVVESIFLVTFIDAYKAARNCKGEDFCLEIPLDQVSINKHLVIFQKYDIVVVIVHTI